MRLARTSTDTAYPSEMSERHYQPYARPIRSGMAKKNKLGVADMTALGSHCVNAFKAYWLINDVSRYMSVMP